MKKLFIALTVLSCVSLWSQEELMKPMERKKPESRKEYFRMYYLIPNGIGDNVLAKANDGRMGLGFAVTFYSWEQLHIIGGYEFIQYDVTDPSLAGNIKNTNMANYYLEALYKIPVIDRVDLNPKFSVAYMTLRQKTHSTNYGQQSGVGFSPGFDVDYRISGGFRVYAGLDYCVSFPDTDTNAEYRSFFGTLQQLNIQFGIKF